MTKCILMPFLGESINQGIILSWLKPVGESIEQGEPFLEITIDKATFVVDADISGVIIAQTANPGELVPVDGIIAVIGDSGEKIPNEASNIKYPNATNNSCLLFRDELDTPKIYSSLSTLNAMRTVIAARMTKSKDEIPHFYVTTDIEMSGCYELRKKLKSEKKRVSYNDMLLKAVGMTLKKFPMVASLYTNEGYIHRDAMHVGFAVAIEPDGLEVPVIRNADKLSLFDIASKAKELATKTRNKKLLPNEFTGSVFTVSNLGGFEVDAFTAIINPGESAILAIGKIKDKPVVEKSQIVIKPIMTVTLSSDHRTIDGVLAAKFNGYLKNLLEAPEQLL